ncbi:ATPase/histidine kinase/DNA gyrase B/HSP90 domain protein [Acetomicrobium hydrogeniformans ATCC BAA-1850]|uniref:histidine kinase n=2 Tax=Acetomicrobium hydrogeniformans TaxID=649746 RepID=A0A0T5X9H4_9BACT|nr:ATPase/histidine kinase/DNA gyrase B/HSP90 domain protein [Acetomicrobium hydrogeniformans ATCC BAA-1850]
MGTMFLCIWIITLSVKKPLIAVYNLINLATAGGDSGYLFAAAGVLVLLNTLRALFLYLGWFSVGHGMARLFGRKWLAFAVPVIMIPFCYQILESLQSSAKPHFGMPAVFGILSVVIIQKLTKDVAGWGNTTLALIPLLFSFQWLDVIPRLTTLGFGWGEVSMAIKGVAFLLERDEILNLLGGIAFITVLAGGLITSELLILSTRQIRHMKRIRIQERQLSRLREEHLRTRSSRELQNLVHDLKRPLTSITGLADVIENSVSQENIKRHAKIIQRAAWGMNQMISEILHPDSRRTITLEEILSYTMSQVSSLDFHRHVEVMLSERESKITLEVNLVRLSRALVNILDNAAQAASEKSKEPHILLQVSFDGSYVLFSVIDNGPGFLQHQLRELSSGRNRTGLGLAFVREVALEHKGTLDIGNSDNGGGKVQIRIPIEREVLL